MAGFAVDEGAIVQCVHAGHAQPVSNSTRVLVNGLSLATAATTYLIADCPVAGPGRCVSAQWLVGRRRVLVAGVPLVVRGDQAVCAPTGTGLVVVATQQRVSLR